MYDVDPALVFAIYHIEQVKVYYKKNNNNIIPPLLLAMYSELDTEQKKMYNIS